MRLLPGSLKGQLIALTLLAVLASQMAGLLVILNDRQAVLTTEWFHNVLGRLSGFIEIIEATPPEFQEKVLRAANTGAVRLVIEHQPYAPVPGGEDPSPYFGELKRALGDRGDRSSLILYPKPNETSRLGLLLGDIWHDIKRSLFLNLSNSRAPRRPIFARLSIPLKNGEWLKATIAPRPFAPPATPLLVQLATMAVLSTLGIIALINRVTRPMKKLGEAAAALGRGEAVGTLEEKGPREVAETVRAFNEMQDRLSRFMLDRTKMFAAMGHDLRTPITSLRLRAEFIEDEEIRLKILETLDEMQQMAEATLSLAKEEAAQEETRLVALDALVSSVCADLTDAGRDVSYLESAEVTVRCRQLGLKRALRNVIENAVAYGVRARVSVETEPGKVVIQVDDDGPGIAEVDREKVFKPFVRLETSRSRETGGVGLGLAIARSIMRGHGGDITLANRADGGLRVTLTLPETKVDAVPVEARHPRPRRVAA